MSKVVERDGAVYQNPHIDDADKSVFSFAWTKYFGDVPFADQQSQAHLITIAEKLEDLKQPANGLRVTWLGHSTFLISMGEVHILTDPILTERASPVSFAGPVRLAPMPYGIGDLPPIDHVVISHNHYDHMDEQTIHALPKDITYHLPLGVGQWFAENDAGPFKTQSYDWWQQGQFADVTITATPSQHWSARGLFDRRHTLWASWVINISGKRIWFGGDTGYNAIDFKQIGERFGPFDLALIPIGAYSPRDFMRQYHINPEEAVQVHQEIGSKRSIGMHWSTFQLSAEPLFEPKSRLEQAAAKAGVEKAFTTLTIGETLYLH
ncbi:MBL fold metallo-hydrolase [Lacimicrobium sp. SS2-24]|uniref:MBL fold metallo-hydrolase n=1 Tax=Lacimicrobium sp. SS2-24 TaxID=2005569 RepID=UPI00143ACDCB|nr:MBL fold metallo-hydrolase [Lacimicrobium sp. SS2-24]